MGLHQRHLSHVHEGDAEGEIRIQQQVTFIHHDPVQLLPHPEPVEKIHERRGHKGFRRHQHDVHDGAGRAARDGPLRAGDVQFPASAEHVLAQEDQRHNDHRDLADFVGRREHEDQAFPVTRRHDDQQRTVSPQHGANGRPLHVTELTIVMIQDVQLIFRGQGVQGLDTFFDHFLQVDASRARSLWPQHQRSRAEPQLQQIVPHQTDLSISFADESHLPGLIVQQTGIGGIPDPQ